MYTIKDAINKAREKHGNKYDYSQVHFKSVTDNVTIICPEHGAFTQTMRMHYRGQGCPKCGFVNRGIKFRDTNETFIEKSKKVWGDDTFDYSKVDYVSSKTKVTLICPEHGEFQVEPNAHLADHRGCPICTKIKIHQEQAFSTEEFIKRAREVHGDKYDYSKVDYKDNRTKVCIICPEHGEFWQVPDSHIRGSECKLCSFKKISERQTLTTKEFIKKAKLKHGDKYSYDKTDYIDGKTPVCITCPTHGDFFQIPYYHLSGNGCQICGVNTSKNEDIIADYCINLLGKNKIKTNCRSVIHPYEIDIYIPSLKIGIEYNGVIWHSNKYKADDYHLKKLELCKERGIKLIQIFEDEFINHKDIVLSKISHILGVQQNLPKIMARKCKIKVIKTKTAGEFLDKNHIQGRGQGSVHLGAFSEDNLIAVMSFKEEHKNSGKWELTRFASDNNYICQGVGGKLFSYFVKNYDPDEVKSFADRRWTVDEEHNVYVQLGFEFDSYLPPEYRYFNKKDGIIRQHKFNFRKQKLHKKYGLPLSMTESEMTKKLGYTKIYDCGLIKYIWKNKKEPKI